jgi:hypothetical protein
VVIDHATNMHRADLGDTWGNCLLPCFFGDDLRQLPPTVVSAKEKDADGNFYNRLANDGVISPVALLRASGLPVTAFDHANGCDHLSRMGWTGCEIYNRCRCLFVI